MFGDNLITFLENYDHKKLKLVAAVTGKAGSGCAWRFYGGFLLGRERPKRNGSGWLAETVLVGAASFISC